MRNKKIKKGFDQLSLIYDWISRLIFGRQLIVAQDYFTDRIKEGSSILIVGGGTGKSLSAIFKHHSLSKITFLDISSGMLAKAKEHVIKYHGELFGKIRFIEGTYEHLPKAETYNVIITPFFLDCLDDKVLGDTLAVLHGRLENNGQWLFTDFNVPSKPVFIKWFSKGIILLFYFFFNIFCKLGIFRLPEFSKHFSRLFDQPQETHYFLRGLLVTQLYIKSAPLKSQGYKEKLKDHSSLNQ